MTSRASRLTSILVLLLLSTTQQYQPSYAQQNMTPPPPSTQSMDSLNASADAAAKDLDKATKALDKHEFDKAIEAATAVIQVQPHNYEAILIRARALVKLRKYPEALRDLDHAMPFRRTPELEKLRKQVLKHIGTKAKPPKP